MCDFLSLRIKEIAVGVRPADDTAGVLKWYLFAARDVLPLKREEWPPPRRAFVIR